MQGTIDPLSHRMKTSEQPPTNSKIMGNGITCPCIAMNSSALSTIAPATPSRLSINPRIYDHYRDEHHDKHEWTTHPVWVDRVARLINRRNKLCQTDVEGHLGYKQSEGEQDVTPVWPGQTEIRAQ